MTKSGRVFSTKQIKEMKQQLNEKGDLRVWLSNNKVVKVVRVHRLVVATFYGEESILNKEVNHLDFNKQNNDISNLEPCSHLENMQHYYKNKK